MFAALAGANVDWNLLAGAVATFIVTAVATWLGLRKGIKKVKTVETASTVISGASIMDNMSILMLHESLKETTQELRNVHNDLIQICTLLQLGLNKRD